MFTILNLKTLSLFALKKSLRKSVEKAPDELSESDWIGFAGQSTGLLKSLKKKFQVAIKKKFLFAIKNRKFGTSRLSDRSR